MDRAETGVIVPPIQRVESGGRQRVSSLSAGHPLPDRSVPSRSRISVAVHAADPLLDAGVRSLLRHPAITISDQSPTTVDVSVIVSDAVGTTALRRLLMLARRERAPKVLVTSPVRDAGLLTIVECGINTVIWRQDATEQHLCRSVLAAAHGEGGMPPDLLARLMAQVARLRGTDTGQPGVRAGLSSREADVVGLVAEGLNTAEIAGQLEISERTVKTVLRGMSARLGLHNRTHAVAYAWREGYI
ncbi:response regulator transcription factor [Streptomyces sp. AC627_RSS907]|uniref:response regulator transcription factor n=1 Tax=Streptomyces sp. AC627_RSS907 TaxID=2823684 RepID=UPI001C23FE9B|nr:LuxR C-terminal-related transcriptional regulator [Streptomyces sp. AC627_RSS907]